VSPNAYFSLQRKKEILPKSLIRLAASLGVPAGDFLAERNAPLPEAPPAVQAAVACLRQFARVHRGFLLWFGSRARTGKQRPGSDWDFGFLGVRPCPIADFAVAKAEAQEAAFPFGVDFVDLNRSPLWFLKSIEDDIVPLS
jgi:hypothetical protein